MKRLFVLSACVSLVLASFSHATGHYRTRNFTFGYRAPVVVAQPVVTQSVTSCGSAYSSQSFTVPQIAPIVGCDQGVGQIQGGYTAPLVQSVVGGSNFGYGGVARITNGGYGYGRSSVVLNNGFGYGSQNVVLRQRVRGHAPAVFVQPVRRGGVFPTIGRFLFGARPLAVRVRVR